MNNKRQLYSEAELLDAISGISSETIEVEDPVMSFLVNFNLESGDNEITASALTQLFRKWSYKNKSSLKLTDKNVTTRIKRFLPCKYNKFYINKNLAIIIKLIADNTKKSKNPTKSKHYQKHIKAFMDAFNIKSGKYNLKKVYLYNLYDKWCYSKSKSSCSYVIFDQLMVLFIDHKNVFKYDKELEYYCVDESVAKYFNNVGSMMLLNNEEFNNARSKKKKEENPE
jgi:hypothetical protein